MFSIKSLYSYNSYMLAFLTLACTKKNSTIELHNAKNIPLNKYLEAGSYTQTEFDKQLLQTIESVWSKHSSMPNFEHLGLRPLYYFLNTPQNIKKYEQDSFPPNKMFLANFGKNGYFIAKILPKSYSAHHKIPFLWANTYVQQNEIPIFPELQFLNQEAKNTCEPLGIHNKIEFSFIINSKENFCIFNKNAKDSRYIDTNISSKLICVNTNTRNFINTRLDKIDLVFRSSFNKNTIFTYESSFTPARITRINTETLSIESSANGTTLLDNLETSNPFTLEEFGVYRCEKKQLTENDSTFSLIYLNKDVYLGNKWIEDDAHLLWEAFEQKNNGLQIKSITWNNIDKEYATFSEIPEINCALKNNFDFKCGLRALSFAVNTLKNASPSSNNNIEAKMQAFTALYAINNKLTHWILEKETYYLERTLAKQLINDNLQDYIKPEYENIAEKINKVLNNTPKFTAHTKQEQLTFIKFAGIDEALLKQLINE